MVDWINKYFGVGNDISVPILVSLIVFIVGGFGTFVITVINGYFKRHNTRKRFKSLLLKLVDNLKDKEKNTQEFYQTIKIDHRGSWSYRHKPISYLEILYLIDFNEIHNAFYRKFVWRPLKLSSKEIAFHEIWDTLGDLKFLESRLEIELDNLFQNFNKFHSDYGSALSAYQEFHEGLLNKVNGTTIPVNKPDLIEYLDTQEKIWNRWHNMDEDKRTPSDITYTTIVNPIFKLNQKLPEVEYAHQSSKFILTCEHSYAEMLAVLKTYNSKFEGYYLSYGKSKNELLKNIGEI